VKVRAVLCVEGEDVQVPPCVHVPLSLLPVALSGAGDLALCKHLIHVHSPQWDPVSGVDQLKTAVGNVLRCANENKIKTVAFPSIASGS